MIGLSRYRIIVLLWTIILLVACKEDSEPQYLTPQLFVNEVQQLTQGKYFFSGSYDPFGKEQVTTATFYYGTTEAMEQSVKATLNGRTATAMLEDLEAGTTYYYCLEIGNGADSRRSEVRSFTTQSAQLSGLVMRNTKFINVVEQQLGRDFQKEADGTVSLDIEYNQRLIEMVTTLDLSDMGDPKIANEIYLFPNLRVLSCGGNGITTLNLMDNPLLEELYCEGKEIRGINEWGNEDLFGHDGVLSTIHLSKSKSLRKLYVGGNKLTRLDLSACSVLEELSCFEDSIKTLDVSDKPALTKLVCYRCDLDELDVTNNPELTYLECYSNQLSSLDVTKNTALKFLYCNWQSIRQLDISQNTELEYLNCHYIDVTKLDLSKNKKLRFLYLWGNPLEDLDVSNNTNLEELDVNYCGLNEIDISKNTRLGHLSCIENNLESLDLSSNDNLNSLSCSLNNITTLDISNTKIGLDNTFGLQHDRNGNEIELTLYVNALQGNQELEHRIEGWHSKEDLKKNVKVGIKPGF